MIVVLFILCLVGTSSVLASCGMYNASDGTQFDLGPLSTALDYSGREMNFPYLYYWNFCQEVKETNCYPPALAIQISETGTCISLGYAPAKITDHPAGPKAGVSITYTNTKDNFCLGGLERISRIVVTCSNSTTNLVRISEPGRCIYLFEMESKYACPISTNPPPPQEGCDNFTSSDGTKYILSPLTRATDYTAREAGTDYIYYWNFCKNISPTGCAPAPTISQVSTFTGSCVPLGYGAPKLTDHPNGPKNGVTLTYTNTQSHLCNGNIPRTAVIEIGCANTDTRILNITEPAVCKYQIEMESIHACPAPRF